MVFPPEFIDELNRVTSVSRILGKFVTWDAKKTKAAKGDYWACCPFHSEKTPSFHATESRGTYYCFSCHEKGNALTFLQKSRGMSFVDSVKFLAAEANLPLPEPTGKEKEQAKKVNHLIRIHEIASRYFQEHLNSKSGKPSQEYLKTRDLKPSTITDFGIGYAPNNLDLIRILNESGYSNEKIIEAGLAKPRDSGNGIYTTFRDRIIFPIQDSRARIIAFGGRAMDPKVPAKYLNSPNTAIFNKGRILYNFHNASSLIDEENPLLVVEGYMDAIALHQAGFTATVAPLGTAVTPEHLAQLWRLSPLPIFAMDGDEAGIRAAKRIVDLSLPLLTPGKSIRFCTLPQGLDPDDLIRKRGVKGMRDCLDQSLEFPDFMWASETLGKKFDTLNSQTLLKDTLNGKINQIKHSVVRNLYKSDFEKRFWETYVRKYPNKQGSKKLEQNTLSKKIRDTLPPEGKPNQDKEIFLQEALLISLCLHHPEIVEDEIGELESYDFITNELNGIRSFMLGQSEDNSLASGNLLDKLKDSEFSQEILELLDIREINILHEISDSTMIQGARNLFQSTMKRLQNIQHQRNLVQEITNSSEEGYNIELLNLLREVNLKQDNIENNILDHENVSPESGRGEQKDDRKRLMEIISSVSQEGGSVSGSTEPIQSSEVAHPPNENEMIMENSHRISKKDYMDLRNLVGK